MGQMAGLAVDQWEELAGAVRKGADLLDVWAVRDPYVVPREWRALIDTDELDQGNRFLCVLAQIAKGNSLDMESFNDMLLVLDLDIMSAVACGFIASEEIKHDHSVLTIAWRRYLEECSAG